MSNASLKEQLEAVASQLSNKLANEHKPKRKFHPAEKMNKKLKPKWLDYVQYGVELLKVYFPSGFKSPNEVKPLKKGIKQDLVRRLGTIESIVTEDKACMVKSLAYYVNTAAYYKSVVEGAVRIDLDGNPAGLVTAEEAKYSVERQQARLQEKQKNMASSTQPQQQKTE
jgi:ProP effector